MNSQLIHIFDNSACLTKRQLKGYVDGSMTNEESHAAEVHLNSCPFCNAAVEGLFAQKEGDLLAVDALNELNADFLKDHFSLTNPQIHLNSIAPAAQQVPTIGRERKKKGKSQPLLRLTSIAAALALVFGVLWFLDYSGNKLTQNKLAQQATVSGAADADNAIVPNNRNNTTTQPLVEEAAFAPVTHAQQPAVANHQQAAPAGEPSPESQRPQALLLTGDDNKDNKEEADKTAAAKDAQPEQVATAKPIEDLAYREGRDANADTKMSLSPDAAKTPVVTTAVMESIETKRAKKPEAIKEADPMDEAHELYAQKKYSKALSTFKKQMNSGSAAQRQEAAIMAARCYLNLGENSKAEELLNNIVEEGGPQKKAAKKLLRQIPPEE